MTTVEISMHPLSFRAIVGADIRVRVQREVRRNPHVNCAENKKAAEAAFVIRTNALRRLLRRGQALTQSEFHLVDLKGYFAEK